ncbi:hypothetical protein D0Z07_8415 [Hyphodiscus hymeniophilus]|uniref:Sacsin/Nov domain-containing protein n=1 Tax=Hyphodiscus hymeniophilus TaxID=353542 RepID=A0A9P6SLT4_9HELO|nr:hypothetical protein D0Z07_8415 [Hyphodiscus hymeniophilus]
MVPKPIGSNAQKQPLTIALKNICRDYPAGSGVLRELLQNADDARATEVRFHLDEGTHPTNNLIDPALAKYQGPALLAYNNAIFTEKDFKSLSQLGNSLKSDDASTTGKFGRGFNSVYNWTDSPSIISCERLLILDPHEEWSTGGPVYDFVEDAEDCSIQNQMVAFQSVMDDRTKPLAGTIIRIPLRTREQASNSEICNNETSVAEIRAVLKSFEADFGDSGLLFMRNVTTITIGPTAEMSSSIEMLAKDGTKVSSFDHSFEVVIRRSSGKEVKEMPFVIHHTIGGETLDGGIQKWAKEQKYTPWVAIAAQIPYFEDSHGSLFTVLPLPIPVNQPVFIHGQFSLSPDRASFYSQDPASAKWNDWLVKEPLTWAWTKILLRMAHLHPNVSNFAWFPDYVDNPNDLLRNPLVNVLKTVAKDSLPIWWTEVGYVSAEEGFLNAGEKSVPLREAFREAQVPVIYAPDKLYSSVERVFDGNILSPRRLCAFLLNNTDRIRDWCHSTKQFILEYLLSEVGFTEVGSLELFPFKDGKYRSIDLHVAYVCRSASEEDLFNLENDHNLDLAKLSESTKFILRAWCSGSAGHKSIRYRSASDFRDYSLSFVFINPDHEQDMTSLDTKAIAFIPKAWKWLVDQQVDITGIISDLWLVPLTNSHYRKLIPRHSESLTFFAPLRPVGDFMSAFDNEFSSKVKPIVQTAELSLQAQGLLTSTSRSNPNLRIQDGSNLVSFARWLHQIRIVIEFAPDDEKIKIMEIIVSNFQLSASHSGYDSIQNDIGSLQIFKKVDWKVEGNKAIPIQVWTSIQASESSIGLLDGVIAVPRLDKVQFLTAPVSSLSYRILSGLKLAQCIRASALVENYIIPNWASLQKANTYSCREQAARLVVSQYSSLSSGCRVKLRKVPIIPVSRITGETTSRFSVAEDLVNPSVLGLKALFFDDEEVIPESDFFDQFKSLLNDIGLKTVVDEALVYSRARKFSSGSHPLSEIEPRANALLRSSSASSWSLFKPSSDRLEFRRQKWLPILDSEGTLQLQAPDQCRPIREQLLVSSQLPVFSFSVSAEWEELLGWRDVLPNNVLLGQLKHGIQASDRAIIDEVLTYVANNDQLPLLIGDLQALPCVLISKGGTYILPSKAFRPPLKYSARCDGLSPYLGNAEDSFWDKHRILLEHMGIREKPSNSDLLTVQQTLESRTPLNEFDIGVAIELLRLFTMLPENSQTGMKVLSEDGNFYPSYEVSHNDLGTLLKPKDKVNLTHPDIPSKYVRKLGIESLHDRLMKGMLDIADIDDEDEFEQHEKVATRIVDTLERYTVDSTFREYLANADDTAGTSRISWLLDERSHPAETLVDPLLKPFQGPALLVHNDGVFSDDDFKGFKNVGEGSKRDKKETIGQYGRGSQTMYHWTDVPMILSGKWLLILDPQQKVLPKNQIKGKRKPGVKLELSKLKDICSDQLAPFEGLWEYTRDLDNYLGTIFRFPLRTQSTVSELRVVKTDLNTAAVRQLFDTYFDEARISLLFLKNVRSIEFAIHGRLNPEWSVIRQKSLDDDPNSFSGWAICTVAKTVESGHQLTTNDKWWIAVEDLKPKTKHLPYSPRRVMKNVECGIAGLVSSTPVIVRRGTDFPSITKPRMFSTLPLPILSDLPVYIHASFSLSGDRQSLVTDEHGLEPYRSQWNKYLLQTALPGLYLAFLDDIGPNVREEVLALWPQKEPPTRSCSEDIYSSFWKQLPQSEGRFFPKYRNPSDSTLRERPKLFSIYQAMFDFLPKKQSETLAPLLLSLGVNLVRNVPSTIVSRLKSIPGVKSVDGTALRDLLKLEENKKILEEQIAVDPSILELVIHLVVPTGNDLTELDGCYILPLVDGTIGQLQLLGSSTTTERFYFVSRSEEELFDFAAELLVSANSGKLNAVVASKKFNLEKLQLHHIGKLLEKSDIKAGQVTPTFSEGDEWLTDFWAYWNKHSVVADTPPAIDISTLPGVYRATCGSDSFYVDPLMLDEPPAVVEPSLPDHQQICDKFPELWRFDQKLMPKGLRDTEKSFTKSASFFRFIRAVSCLARKKGDTLGDFAAKHMSIEDLKVHTSAQDHHVDDGHQLNFWQVLRCMLVCHAGEDGLSPKAPLQEIAQLQGDLRSLPLWPTQGSEGMLIPATSAKIAGQPGFLVPWMRDFAQFINPQAASEPNNQKCLALLGIPKLNIQYIIKNHILPLPPLSTHANWTSYQKFVIEIASISSSKLAPIKDVLFQTRLAVDGNRSLRYANELFDHDDEVFRSAFRGEETTKFLHSDVRACRQFWLNVGLRHRANEIWNPLDLIKCLQSLSLRQRSLTDKTHLAADAAVVLRPLTAPNSSIRGFESHWTAISKESVFDSRSNFPSGADHRTFVMKGIAAERPLSDLSQLVSYKHVAVCWSQTPFAINEPTTEVFAAVNGGNPSTEMVWKHLEYLAEMSQQLAPSHLPGFLEDLHNTYSYLQDHVTMNDHFAARWSGSLPSEPVITYSDDEMSYHTLSTMIDYAYEEKINWGTMTAKAEDDETTRAAKLHMLIDLHKGADYWLIETLKSEVECMLIASFKLCVNVQNVRDIAVLADQIRAREFEKMCKEFYQKNKAVVDRASGSVQ